MTQGDMRDLLAATKRHMREVHQDTNYGNRIREYHDERYPNCDERPQLSDYTFLGIHHGQDD